MSSPAQQPERQGTPPVTPSTVDPQNTYAFIYAPGPQWLAGPPGDGAEPRRASRLYGGALRARPGAGGTIPR